MLKKIAKLIETLVLIGVLLYALQWAYVAHRLVYWCDYYPESLADCRE